MQDPWVAPVQPGWSRLWIAANKHRQGSAADQARRTISFPTYWGCRVRRKLAVTRATRTAFPLIVAVLGFLRMPGFPPPLPVRTPGRFIRPSRDIGKPVPTTAKWCPAPAAPSALPRRRGEASGPWISFPSASSARPGGRAAIMEAVRWAEPLPYRGFENAFQHEISIVFQAASIEDRQALAAMQAATRRANEENAESDRQWATPRRPQQLDDYRRRCVFHLSWNVPRVALQPPRPRPSPWTGLAGWSTWPGREEKPWMIGPLQRSTPLRPANLFRPAC